MWQLKHCSYDLWSVYGSACLSNLYWSCWSLCFFLPVSYIIIKDNARWNSFGVPQLNYMMWQLMWQSNIKWFGILSTTQFLTATSCSLNVVRLSSFGSFTCLVALLTQSICLLITCFNLIVHYILLQMEGQLWNVKKIKVVLCNLPKGMHQVCLIRFAIPDKKKTLLIQEVYPTWFVSVIDKRRYLT